MRIKLLQLNIFKGKFLDTIIDLVKKEDVDIVQFQEVTGGKKSNGGVYAYPQEMHISPGESNKKVLGANLFEYLRNYLDMEGKLVVAHRIQNDLTSYEGNATFFKKDIAFLEEKIVWLKEYKEIEETYTEWETIGRAALSLKLEYQGMQFYVINAHLAWGRTTEDEDYKLDQAKKLVTYIKTLHQPFILTGDFNVTPETKSIALFNSVARNLITENTIQNTLNFNVHQAKHLFPPGIAVDYIFVDKRVRVKDFRAIENINLSDHIGLLVEFEL